MSGDLVHGATLGVAGVGAVEHARAVGMDLVGAPVVDGRRGHRPIRNSGARGAPGEEVAAERTDVLDRVQALRNPDRYFSVSNCASK